MMCCCREKKTPDHPAACCSSAAGDKSPESLSRVAVLEHYIDCLGKKREEAETELQAMKKNTM